MFISIPYSKISMVKCHFCQLYKIHISHITEWNKFQSFLETESQYSLHFKQLLK